MAYPLARVWDEPHACVNVCGVVLSIRDEMTAKQLKRRLELELRDGTHAVTCVFWGAAAEATATTVARLDVVSVDVRDAARDGAGLACQCRSAARVRWRFAAGAAPPPGDDKLVSDELFDWLRALGGAAKAAYLDAWRGAAAAADDGGPGGDDLDADASSKRLKKRFAHFNGHFETLATATAKWACDDAALRDELKADLKRLVADPWEAFYARNAHRPFSSKHQDKYTRWAPSLVDAALDRCFDPGRATAPRRPSTHWAGAAAQAALPPP